MSLCDLLETVLQHPQLNLFKQEHCRGPNAVPDDATDPKNWFGLNTDGQIYRFSAGDGRAHFSGIDGVGPGIGNITPYAEQRLDALW